MQAYTGTLTYRRELRQTIRNRLGTSGSPAPTLMTLVSVVEYLNRLVDYTTGGALGVAFTNRKTGGDIVSTQKVRELAQDGPQGLKDMLRLSQ